VLCLLFGYVFAVINAFLLLLLLLLQLSGNAAGVGDTLMQFNTCCWGPTL
jgi:hypothetical protein